MKKTLAVYTLGCRVNAFEAACMRDAARNAGWTVVDWDCGADVGIVNSCALTKLAEAKTRQTIRIFARKNPHCKIAITGCYAQTSPESLAAMGLENIAWIVDNKSKGSIVQIISDGVFGCADGGADSIGAARASTTTTVVPQNVYSGAAGESAGAAESARECPSEVECSEVAGGGLSESRKEAAVNVSAVGGSSASKKCPPSADSKELSSSGDTPLDDRMNLKIQDGCDNACAYCIIPRARGLPRSMDFDAIVRDAENLVSRGVRELVLTGINISKFSTPRGGLIELIDRLNEIENLYRLRLGSVEPPLLPLEAVLERAADSSHALMPHLHISAQSLSDAVLARMRRHYTARDFLDMVEKCVAGCADISIGGDIICGHPGETRAEFDLTKRLLADSPMSYAHVFTFSPRPKTLAWTMKDVPEPAERKARADELREVAARLHLRFAETQVGKVRPLLLENKISDGAYFAHTDNYIQASVALAKDGMKNALVRARIARANSDGSVCCELL